MDFQERLKTIRNSKGLSQKSLAEKINMSQQSVAKWETGDSTPSPATLNKLSEILGVSVDFLIGKTDTEVLYDKESHNFLFLFNDETPKTAKNIDEITVSLSNEIRNILFNIEMSLANTSCTELSGSLQYLDNSITTIKQIVQELQNCHDAILKKMKLSENKQQLLKLISILEKNNSAIKFYEDSIIELSESEVIRINKNLLNFLAENLDSNSREEYKANVGFTDPTAARRYYEANASFAPSSSGEEPTDEEIIQLANELYEEQKANKKQ